MILKEFQSFFSAELASKYPQSEIDSFFAIIIEEQLGLQRIDTVLQPNFFIDKANLSTLKKVIKRLQKEEPIQYIFGKTEFFGLPFFVDKNTLIPRPETEELVAWIIEEVENSKKKNITILDIGTGSGCIAISLQKKLPKSTISAIDISEKAIVIAKKNAKKNKVNINFFKADILKTTSLDEIFKKENTSFDIIVSNPPYVRELEKAEIKNNVLQNEPHLALFVDDENPLLFYKKIAGLAKQNLTKNGLLFFEINQYLFQETIELLNEFGFYSTKLKKDIFKNNRMLKARL